MKLIGEELDLALHECMAEIWRAYRESVAEKNFKKFNETPSRLYEKYDDETVVFFIKEMAFSLSWAASRQILYKKEGGAE